MNTQWLQIIAALLPIIEQLIAAVEAAAHPGSTMTVPPQAARLRDMLEGVKATHAAATAEAAEWPMHEITAPDDAPREHLTRLAALERIVADLHAALSDKPSPAGVQKAVADVEVPAA